MSERTEKLVEELQVWAKARKIKSKELAEWLKISPQTMTDMFKGRSKPTGEQVLVMLELLGRLKPRS